jgi:hypothetical protein
MVQILKTTANERNIHSTKQKCDEICVSDSRWREVPGALLTGKDAALYVYQKRLYVSGIVLFQNNNSTARCTKYENQHKSL